MKIYSITSSYLPQRTQNINQQISSKTLVASPPISPSFTGKTATKQLSKSKTLLLTALASIGLFKVRDGEDKENSKILFEAYKRNPELTQKLADIPYEKYTPRFHAKDIEELVRLNETDPDFVSKVSNKHLDPGSCYQLMQLYKKLPQAANNLAVPEFNGEECRQLAEVSMNGDVKQAEEAKDFIRKYSQYGKHFTADEIKLIPMCVTNIPKKYFDGVEYLKFREAWQSSYKPHVYEKLRNLSIVDKNVLMLDMIDHWGDHYLDTDIEALEASKKRLAAADNETLQKYKNIIINFLRHEELYDQIYDAARRKPIYKVEDANKAAQKILEFTWEGCSKKEEKELINEVVIPIEKINNYFSKCKPDSYCDIWGYAAESIYQHMRNNEPIPDDIKDLWGLHTSGIARFDMDRGIFRYNFSPVLKNSGIPTVAAQMGLKKSQWF